MFSGVADAVYTSRPTRRRLAKACLVTGGLDVALIAVVVLIAKTTPPFAQTSAGFSASAGGLIFVALAVLLLIPICTLWCLLVLYRLARPGYSLAITHVGIVDNCTLFATGVGLIRWENLVTVNPVGYGPSARDMAVRIGVRDPAALLEGRPRAVRVLRRLLLVVTRVDTDLFVPVFMIDSYRAGDLVAVIRKEYEARRAADRHLAALPPARIIV